ncbi:2-phosphosulfolactate phosphatase [Duffyella gerundensis]|uniref:2-phosphosulfolactate phosphatase n=1 Tax=Duffyella TaxID=3026546 RepID=UPI003F6DAB0B
MTWYTQDGFKVRLEWGIQALEALHETIDCAIVVDAISFSTCVSLAVERGAMIYPWPWKDESAQHYAASLGAEAASSERRFSGQGRSLSPCSLVDLPTGSRLVLPSPNGSAIAFRAAELGVTTWSGCFRNRTATARACADASRILVIPCGEKWPDGSLRPAAEDYLAAGSIIAALGGNMSPEAAAAAAAWQQCEIATLYECASARELSARGFADDVALCLAVDASNLGCRLQQGYFIAG